ncbi:MAG: DNA repair protein RecO [Alkalimonas sp.]|nr:DNA repair protein RecO [Alkalimonas sp.]
MTSARYEVWGMASSNRSDSWLSAYILHSRPLAEHKVILQLLLPEHGRLSAVARKKSGKQQRSLQPFQSVLLQLSGQAELKSVRKLEEQGPALLLQGTSLYSGLYLNELLCRVWPNNLASDHLYGLYQSCLHRLALAQQQAEAIERALRTFEFDLLSELGQPINWQFDASEQPIQPGIVYQWQHDSGWIASHSFDAQNGWAGQLILQVAAGDFSSIACRRAAKQMSRTFLQPWLGTKPLSSRALFQQHSG